MSEHRSECPQCHDYIGRGAPYSLTVCSTASPIIHTYIITPSPCSFICNTTCRHSWHRRKAVKARFAALFTYQKPGRWRN